MELLWEIALLAAICTQVLQAAPVLVADSWIERGQLKLEGEPNVKVNYELLDSGFEDDKVSLIYRVSMSSPDGKSEEADGSQQDAPSLFRSANGEQAAELRMKTSQPQPSDSHRQPRGVLQKGHDSRVPYGFWANNMDSLWRKSETSSEESQGEEGVVKQRD